MIYFFVTGNQDAASKIMNDKYKPINFTTMNDISELLMAAIVFAALYGALQLIIRRKERLLLIEKGMNSPELKSDLPVFSGLKFGLFFIGIGIGVLIASILTAMTLIEPEVAYFSMIFLFGGLALVIHHVIEKKQKQNQG